ncbi:MAG: hypothetical protein LUD47_00265 [Clostridia bacterium]|nr:hypothetical protein [Clostridia bacterium]
MSKKYSASYIKIFRKMMHWEWYRDTKTKALFLHCLLRASWEPGEWMGIHYEAGQFITSIASLAEETGLSVSEVRTALEHLVSTGEITRTTTREATKPHAAKCSVITVKNWSQYQKATRVPTQGSAQTGATLKERKERKETASLPDGSAAASPEDDELPFEDASVLRERARKERSE